jgi:hypothetical protein
LSTVKHMSGSQRAKFTDLVKISEDGDENPAHVLPVSDYGKTSIEEAFSDTGNRPSGSRKIICC